MIAEVVLTMMFLFIIMGATHGRAPVGFAPIAIGLGLTLIHLISIQVDNTSVNPARSLLFCKDILVSSPFGPRYAWGIVQHEYAHQVDFLLFGRSERRAIRRVLGGVR